MLSKEMKWLQTSFRLQAQQSKITIFDERTKIKVQAYAWKSSRDATTTNPTNVLHVRH